MDITCPSCGKIVVQESGTADGSVARCGACGINFAISPRKASTAADAPPGVSWLVERARKIASHEDVRIELADDHIALVQPGVDALLIVGCLWIVVSTIFFGVLIVIGFANGMGGVAACIFVPFMVAFIGFSVLPVIGGCDRHVRIAIDGVRIVRRPVPMLRKSTFPRDAIDQLYVGKVWGNHSRVFYELRLRTVKGRSLLLLQSADASVLSEIERIAERMLGIADHRVVLEATDRSSFVSDSTP